jgi:hypothetical protein
MFQINVAGMAVVYTLVELRYAQGFLQRTLSLRIFQTVLSLLR